MPEHLVNKKRHRGGASECGVELVMIVASEATPGEAVPAHREDLLDSPAGERAWRTAGSGGSDPGRPACPSSRKRRSHLYAVARETPTPAAVCAGVQPNSTTRVTTSSLPSCLLYTS